MSHQQDYDRNHDREDRVSARSLRKILEESLQMEEEMMRVYLITAERVHDNEELQIRLRNFAEGNAKRSQQLIDELKQIH
ncbi:hypothetical protein [Scopulibacillus cellulosilyticus]|uniref:Spore coat protein n=1 Tax=Scopulibacillus cellulosilyticus TaxID=2665665 RepID=A0ABW2PPW8_9BACL